MTSPHCGFADSLRSEVLPKRNAERGRRVRAAAADRSQHQNPVAGRRRESSTPRPSPLSRNLVGLKVVVVDDDADSLDYFAMALRTYGAVVITASTALDALRLVQEERPDVVLSDIAMRGEDGYWLVREIRRLADQAVSLVPVVAATAYDEHSRTTTLAAGFSEHLAKPVDPELLCHTIANAAGR
jgi:CheY-like chemotaxis protein